MEVLDGQKRQFTFSISVKTNNPKFTYQIDLFYLKLVGILSVIYLVVAAILGRWLFPGGDPSSSFSISATGTQLFFYLWLFLLIFIPYLHYSKSRNNWVIDSEKQKIETSQNLSKTLNEILDSTNKLISSTNSIPQQYLKEIKSAELLFNEGNAHDFWHTIKSATETLNGYRYNIKKITSMLSLYLETLENTPKISNTFPSEITILIVNISILDIDNLNKMTTAGKTTQPFNLIFEHIITQTILIQGFKGLNDAITNLGNEIVGAIASLSGNISKQTRIIESNLKIISDNTLENAISQKDANKILEQTREELTKMDNKLYYLYHGKKPLTTFSHR